MKDYAFRWVVKILKLAFGREPALHQFKYCTNWIKQSLWLIANYISNRAWNLCWTFAHTIQVTNANFRWMAWNMIVCPFQYGSHCTSKAGWTEARLMSFSERDIVHILFRAHLNLREFHKRNVFYQKWTQVAEFCNEYKKPFNQENCFLKHWSCSNWFHSMSEN